MLSQQDAKNLIDQAIGYSKLPGCQVDLHLDGGCLHPLRQ